MEVFAGFTAQVDHEIGRVIDYARSLPNGDNTLIFYIIGDNGASAEGGLTGTINERHVLQRAAGRRRLRRSPSGRVGRADDLPPLRRRLGLGDGHALPVDQAGGLPFRGHAQPADRLLAEADRQAGEVRSQFHHVIDVAPTILEVARIPQPTIVNGIAQKPIEGISMAYTFDDATAPDRRTQQYFEMLVNRACTAMAGSPVRGPSCPGWPPIEGHRRCLQSLHRAVGAVQHRQRFHRDDRSGQAGTREIATTAGSVLGAAAKYDVLPLQWETADRWVARHLARPSYTRGELHSRTSPA